MTTAFAAVIDISIDGSRFGSSADIRQFISAFRNLTALELDGVNILSPVAGPRYLDLSKAACSPVKWLRMENLHLYAIPRGGSTAIAYLVFLNPILDLCSTFTSLSMLHIRRCTFGSFDDLRRFVCCFPRLRQLKMMDVGWDTTFPRRLTLPLLDEGPGLLRLDTFHARVASYTHGDRLLQWLATSLPNHTLESLDIRPCSASLVGRTLRAIGGSLERLTLYTTASDGENLPTLSDVSLTQPRCRSCDRADYLRQNESVYPSDPDQRPTRHAHTSGVAPCNATGAFRVRRHHLRSTPHRLAHQYGLADIRPA
ncbi:uncharacterized protein C8Q71DRAFT_74463 [Rhodofomes roseus]|uniref:Uncharacterized protein n=1 Tax=Rhodofomes roseus TaxID=34475 RepID=A0ABQ8KEW3_9APHY|nr:uncharacterized protein C8Q71DRAFT_74463 [Rhodofomes roseus]KAH9836272.1 hypothetical protein C8Q71DRAFT_74463 [Rhodofomes roseus]